MMSWVAHQRRWTKQYRGKTFSVSCRQLKCEPTKEASRVAANDWWASKQKEIDELLGQAKRHPVQLVDHYERAIEQHRLFAKWQRRYGDPAKAEKAETMVEFLKDQLTADDPPYPLPPQQQRPIDMMYEVLGEDDYEDPTVWYERFKQIKREEEGETSAPKENTIRAHVDDYLATRKTAARAENKLGTYNTIETRLNVFRRWVDPFAEITTLNEVLWERFCVHLAKRVNDGELAAETRAGIQRVVRAFIRNRWERRFIDLPRNLSSRTLSAPVPLQEVVTFSKKEVASLLAVAPERTRLYLLLALNCGFYGVDIAAMKQTEVEWSKGRICRQRTKTRNTSASVPKVDYLLWRQTFEVLKRCRSKHPQLALTNHNGNPLWSETEKDGKFTRNNNVKTAYFRLWETKFKKTKGFKPFKTLRKTAASLLENHKEYGRYAEYFLGEVPSSIAGRHYVKPSAKQFDAAIRWLGKQLGIE